MTTPHRPLSAPFSFTRRRFLATGASLATTTLCAPYLRAASVGRGAVSGYPFTLGIASGDPAPDSVVLWTRLAPRPLEPGGGMPPEPVEVTWEIADDERMTRHVHGGTALADPEWAHAVHVEVGGLQPDRWYWYRFRVGGEASPVGRTRTLPAVGVMPERLRFAFASCQKYEIGYYTAYEHMARESLDLIVHLGDYIYEKGDGGKAVRPHGTPEIITLDDYRRRYAVYKTDPALQAAHAMAPWIVTWDDHELSNNYADLVPEHPERTTPEAFLRRRIAAYHAYYEHMPLRAAARPRGPALPLHRELAFGGLARFHVLDTRQYRSDQANGDGAKPVNDAVLDPSRTLLGRAQREWLFRGLADPSPAWNVMAQQIPVARIDVKPGPEMAVSMDKWSGYEAERRALLRHLRDARVRNPVVLTGDVHANWANELALDFEGSGERSVGVEFVGTSITSDGDGADRPANHDTLLAENPWVKFHNTQRGYVRCDVTPELWRTDYQVVPYVSRPGAPLTTRASFVVESGQPHLQPA
ncbi:MAG TPA: alkaline phosphatase D family protein [Opitutaceae bacterium]